MVIIANNIINEPIIINYQQLSQLSELSAVSTYACCVSFFTRLTLISLSPAKADKHLSSSFLQENPHARFKYIYVCD